MTIGILGASTYAAAALADSDIDVVVTPYGDQPYEKGTIDGIPIVWIRRFGWGNNRASHLVNHRAHMAALSALGVRRAFTLNGFGSANPAYEDGDLAVPHDYIKFLHRDPPSIMPDLGWTRVDMGAAMGGPYCPEIREALIRGAKQSSERRLWERGVNLCVQGPHLETQAEVEMFRTLGADLVSTTIYPELVYARELGICFASFCWITNPSGGAAVKRWVMVPPDEVAAIVRSAVKLIPSEPRGCHCQDR